MAEKEVAWKRDVSHDLQITEIWLAGHVIHRSPNFDWQINRFDWHVGILCGPEPAFFLYSGHIQNQLLINWMYLTLYK